MVGAYFLVGIVWAWLLFELSVYNDKSNQLREFGYLSNYFAIGLMILTWPLSMIRVARNLLKNE